MTIPKFLINYLFLVPLFCIGAFCVYGDLKDGKIRNKYIIIGLSWVIVLYLSLFLYTYFGLQQISNLQYISELLTNGVIALIVGYVLWYFNLWAAGDAKLFTIYAFLIPLEFYAKSYFPYFPSFALLVDIFMLILLFLVGKMIILRTKNFIRKIQANYSSWSPMEFFKKLVLKIKKPDFFLPGILRIGKLLLTYFSIFFIVQLISGHLNLLLAKVITEPVFICLLFFLAQRYVFKFVLKYKILNLVVTLVGIGGAIYLFAFNQGFVFWRLMKMVIFLMLFISGFIKLLNSHIEHYETRTIKVSQIKPGFFVSSNNILRMSKMIQAAKMNTGFGPMESDGINVRQAALIKTLFKGKPKAEISIYNTFPFAPFIMAAALISVATQNSFLPLLSQLFRLIR